MVWCKEKMTTKSHYTYIFKIRPEKSQLFTSGLVTGSSHMWRVKFRVGFGPNPALIGRTEKRKPASPCRREHAP